VTAREFELDKVICQIVLTFIDGCWHFAVPCTLQKLRYLDEEQERRSYISPQCTGVHK